MYLPFSVFYWWMINKLKVIFNRSLVYTRERLATTVQKRMNVAGFNSKQTDDTNCTPAPSVVKTRHFGKPDITLRLLSYLLYTLRYKGFRCQLPTVYLPNFRVIGDNWVLWWSDKGIRIFVRFWCCCYLCWHVFVSSLDDARIYCKVVVNGNYS